MAQFSLTACFTLLPMLSIVQHTATAQPAAAALGPTIAANERYDSSPRPKVLVIGAGIAGVAAARDLVDNGVDVLVVEARNRPGGRLHSVQTQVGVVDLGAMWIHEAAPGNAIYDLTDHLGINKSQLHNYGSAALFNPDGTRASYFVYAATAAAFNRDVKGRIAGLRATVANNSRQHAVQDMPLSTICQAWIDSHKSRWTPEQFPWANLIIHTEFQTLLNANVSTLSTLRYGDAKTLPNRDVLLQPGYDEIVRKLIPGLNITYNTTVASISQSADGVTVNTTDGQTYTADYVFVTVSLGVLKAGMLTFLPPLPAEKAVAIREMGMGVLDKVILVFPEDQVFWNKGVDFITFARNDWSGRWSSWLNYYKMWHIPVLVALNSADTARELEGMSDAEVVEEAMTALRLMYGNNASSAALNSNRNVSTEVPQPVEYYVTRWAADPLARGSYSYYATGNALNITDVLAEPFGRVLFAGEASSHKPATVLGAYLSGKREANRILKTLELNNSGTSQTTGHLRTATNGTAPAAAAAAESGAVGAAAAAAAAPPAVATQG